MTLKELREELAARREKQRLEKAARFQRQREEEIAVNAPWFERAVRRLWDLWLQGGATNDAVVRQFFRLQKFAERLFGRELAMARFRPENGKPDPAALSETRDALEKFSAIAEVMGEWGNEALQEQVGRAYSYEKHNRHWFGERIERLRRLCDKNEAGAGAKIDPPLEERMDAFVPLGDAAKRYFGRALLDYQFAEEDRYWRLSEGFCTVIGCDARGHHHVEESGDWLCRRHHEEDLKKPRGDGAQEVPE